MLPPVVAWGLLARGIGLTYAISFTSIALQIRVLAGRDGIAPFGQMLRQIRRDFPWTHGWYFPSLFWLTGASDAALLLLPICGALAGLCWAVGAPSPYLGEAAPIFLPLAALSFVVLGRITAVNGTTCETQTAFDQCCADDGSGCVDPEGQPSLPLRPLVGSPPSPPAPPPPSPPACPVAATANTCDVTAAQLSEHCSCQYVWTDGCEDAPSGVAMHCE